MYRKITCVESNMSQSTGSYWLDAVAPYNTTPAYANDMSGKKIIFRDSDSPCRALPQQGGVSAEINDRFKMYCLFTPEGEDSIAVPIGLLEWNWKALALNADHKNDWYLIKIPNEASFTGKACSIYPEWTTQAIMPDQPPLK